jgi:hypothetical protein
MEELLGQSSKKRPEASHCDECCTTKKTKEKEATLTNEFE